MKYILVLLLLIPLIALSQSSDRSFFYNSNGQLKIDTVYSINLNQYRIWCNLERNIVTHIVKGVKYNVIAMDQQIAGSVIISFDCDSTKLKNIQIVKSSHELLNESAIKGIENKKNEIFYELRYALNLKGEKEFYFLGTYYLVLDFNLINIQRESKRKAMIPIYEYSGHEFSRWSN